MSRSPLIFQALPGIPEIEPGAELPRLIMEALAAVHIVLAEGDVLVVAQKIVSKSEGRYLDLRTIEPSARAKEIAAGLDKDPRFVEAILAESAAVIRSARGVLITRHRLGLVMANAGIDRSNLANHADEDTVLLLPGDPDESARRLRQEIRSRSGVAPGIVISDSFGRPWRLGVVNFALGAAGITPLKDLRNVPDRVGRRMQSTAVAIADAIAAGAGLAMGEADESTPVIHVRGLGYRGDGEAKELIRPVSEDLFL